jgi:long-chain acyl-CoA synthetase
MEGVGLVHFARTDPDRTALIDPQGVRWSYGRLVEWGDRFRHLLREAGIGPGTVCVVACPNSAELVATYFAVLRAGLYVLSINWNLTPDEIAYVLKDSGARVIVTHRRVWARMRPVIAKLEEPTLIKVIGGAPGYTPLEDELGACPATPLPPVPRGRNLIYTSATTGRPKAIELPLADSDASHARMLAAHAGFHAEAGIAVGSGAAHLCTTMLYHATPMDCASVAIELGHPAVLMDHWSPEETLRLIDAHAVRSTMMVPSMFVRLLRLPEEVRRRYSTSTLRFVSHGCAPCAPEIKRQMIDWWGPVFWEMYGASEGSGTYVDSHGWLKYPGTVGRPILGAAIRILDDDGAELPPGVPGAIYLKRYTGDRFAYRGDPEKTQAAYRGDFFTAGDIGYVNEEGYLFICDRRADLIISGGQNIYPAEVERVLLSHSMVADCAVFGAPDSLLGESVRAAVELVEGCEPGPQLKADILTFLTKSLTAAKIPRSIEYVKALPRDPSGKLFKRRLRERYLADALPGV